MVETGDLGAWRAWRDEQRKRPRVMKAAEYRVWCRAGDDISHPSATNAFPGGLTITFDNGIIGRFCDEHTDVSPPAHDGDG